RLAVSENIPREAEARSEVVPVVVVVLSALLDGEIGQPVDLVHLVALIEVALQTVFFKRDAKELIAQAGVQREAGSPLPVILKDVGLRPVPDVAIALRTRWLILLQIAVVTELHVADTAEQMIIEILEASPIGGVDCRARLGADRRRRRVVERSAAEVHGGPGV